MNAIMDNEPAKAANPSIEITSLLKGLKAAPKRQTSSYSTRCNKKAALTNSCRANKLRAAPDLSPLSDFEVDEEAS